MRAAAPLWMIVLALALAPLAARGQTGQTARRPDSGTPAVRPSAAAEVNEGDAAAGPWTHYAAANESAAAEFNEGYAALSRNDWAKAAYWFGKAAAQGDARAESILGLLYDEGQGVPQDYVAAYKWFILAKAGAKPGGESYKAAGQLMDALGGALMTPAQVAQAQAEAAAWWQAHPKAHGGQQ